MQLRRSGNALATTIAAPLGSFLGQFIGWRGAFFIVAPLAAIVLVWQAVSLPAMPSDRRGITTDALALLRRREAALGIAGVTLRFVGQFARFTYLRSLTTKGVSVSVLSLILLVMGLTGAVGSALIPKLIARSLRTALVGAPAGLAVIGLPSSASAVTAWRPEYSSRCGGWWAHPRPWPGGPGSAERFRTTPRPAAD